MDLNLSVDGCGSQIERIKMLLDRAFEFGYGTVAVNTIVDTRNLSGKNIFIPQPKLIDFRTKSTKEFRVLNRITAVIEDESQCHQFLNSPMIKKYDIVALQPIGEKMLQQVYSLTDIDIICIDMTEKEEFKFKRRTLKMATRKNICFEIIYAPCLMSETSKRRVFTNAQLLVNTLKGENVLVSSGATNPMELRSVEDVMNLALLFGLEKNQADASVRKIGKLVLKHARTRNETGCGFVSLTGLYMLPKHQGWIVNACKVPKLSSFMLNVNEVSNVEGNERENIKRKVNEVSNVEGNIRKQIKSENLCESNE